MDYGNNYYRGVNYSTQPSGANLGPTVGAGSISAGAGSTGFNYPFGLPTPDLRYADQGTLNRLNISNLIYSPTAGGYLTQGEANNANSYYNKFGAGQGGDPQANKMASAYYNYIGSLPTRPIGTPALNQFYAQFGGGYGSGPSYNSILGGSYQGPYGYGLQNTNYNQYGQYHGFGMGGGPMAGTAW